MGQCVHQASCFHTELVPADPVWSPPNAILDNRKGNILEPFPLSYCVWKRLLLIFSFLFHGGLVSYLNGTHGTCVCVCVCVFSCNWDQKGFCSPAAFPGSPRCFLRLCRAVGGSFLRDEASGAGVPPSCPSHTGSPTLIVSASHVV